MLLHEIKVGLEFLLLALFYEMTRLKSVLSANYMYMISQCRVMHWQL